MSLLVVSCAFCQGEGQLDEALYPLGLTPDTCPCCQGDGFIEKPQHENTFNAQPLYLGLKAKRLQKRKQRNSVILGFLERAA